jgi:hypothetical protein
VAEMGKPYEKREGEKNTYRTFKMRNGRKTRFVNMRRFLHTLNKRKKE